MKKQILLTTIIIALGLIVSLNLVYATVIDDPGDAGPQLPTISSDGVSNAPPSAQEGNIAKLVQYIYTLALLAAGLAVIGGLIYGGVLYLFAGGSSTQVAKAKDRIRGALYGLGLILISYLILYTINPALVNLVNPTADPLKLKTGSIWSLNSSYGMMLGNTSAGRPCVGDFDCNYDLACCPATDSSGNRVSSCRQNFANEANPTGNPDTKTDLKTDTAPKNEPWFQCGWAEPDWLLVSQNTTCENINTFRKANIKGTPECTDPKDCCDNADISQRYIPDGKKAICCQAPNLVISKDKPECDFLYGKGGDNPATPETENKANKNSQCADATGCIAKVATCQPIWPHPTTDANKDDKPDDPKSYVTSLWLKKKSAVNDKLGDPCQINEAFILDTFLQNIFHIGQSPRDTCQDSRLICNTKFKTCTEPQSINGPCGDDDENNDSDCCQNRYWWIPACEKYTSRGISLKCDKINQTCTFKNAADEAAVGEGTAETGTEADANPAGLQPDQKTCVWMDNSYVDSAGKTKFVPVGSCDSVTRALAALTPKPGGLRTDITDFNVPGQCAGSRSTVPGAQNNLCCCKALTPNSETSAGLDTSLFAGIAHVDAQAKDASARLTKLINCMVIRTQGVNAAYPVNWVITSISDDHGMNKCTGTAYPTQCPTSGGDSCCWHTENSCHYGGTNCVGKSYAFDADNISNRTNFDTAVKTCASANGLGTPWINNESTHVHISIGAATGCGCDT